MLAAAGWDEAVEFVRKREHRRRAPVPDAGGGRPIYGMPGAQIRDRRPDLRSAAPQEYPELR